MKKTSKATACVHSGRVEQGVNTPIYVSSANRYIGYEENVYPRYFNTDNQQVVADKLCSLENAEKGMVFSSGMAAISTALLGLLNPGDHILFSHEIYGGTFNLLAKEFEKYGIWYTIVESVEVEEFRKRIKPNTKAIYSETPSNPLLTIVDLKAMADLANEHDLITFVDNTFASPINQNPIDLGFDVVLHSGTKYLGGHSDLAFGAVLTSEKLIENVHRTAVNLGGSLNALDCYLIERSLKTLDVRVRRQNENAQIVAEYLLKHPMVKKVFYPGLPSHPNHETAKSQMLAGFGGMLSFELENPSWTDAFLDSLELIIPSLSLGGVETIICQPSKTSHIKLTQEARDKLGITDGLLRLSVGLESPEEIIADITNAIHKAQA